MPCRSAAPAKSARQDKFSAIAVTFARGRHPTAALSKGLRHMSLTRQQHYDNRGCRYCVQLYVSRISPLH